jgi:polyphosphate glucokinase
MQALGSYEGGKMPFLGLRTGLESTIIIDGIAEPMELGHPSYKEDTYEDYVGRVRLERRGKKKWRHHVADVTARLITAPEPDDTVLGGGYVKTELPHCRADDNTNAFRGDFVCGEMRTLPLPHTQGHSKQRCKGSERMPR